MPKLITCYEHSGKTGLVAVHHVTVPTPTEQGFYRSTVSYSYFGQRELKRRFPTDKKTGAIYTPRKINNMRWCSVDWEPDKFGTRYQYERDKVPHYDHDSIWDFYKAIGYDYKKKKYI